VHVAPADFRSVRSGALDLRFALLGDVAYVLADLPNGSAGTPLEETCSQEHWAFVVEGSVTLVLGRRRRVIGPGTAFHVAAGVRHRLLAHGPLRLAGFAPVDPASDNTDAGLRALGFETVALPVPIDRGVPSVAPPDGRMPERGEIAASAHRMGDLVFTRAVLGPRSGYTAAWCDMPHWGLVTAGAIAIEWEDDVEILSAGDVYYCQAGPPGHRLQAADGATLIDFSPAAAMRTGGRVAPWRSEVAAAASGASPEPEPLAIASLG
jgi:quercetin dioxygenase-like cupin family protein